VAFFLDSTTDTTPEQEPGAWTETGTGTETGTEIETGTVREHSCIFLLSNKLPMVTYSFIGSHGRLIAQNPPPRLPTGHVHMHEEYRGPRIAAEIARFILQVRSPPSCF
jgi:hypothetical protein